MKTFMHSRTWLGGFVLAAALLAAETALAQTGAPAEPQQRSDLYRFATRYFWLIFPIMGMIWGMVDLAARHRRAREGLQLIKSYIDQGKEPPPALLKFLDGPGDVYGNNGKFPRHGGWVAVFLFAGLTTAFTLFGIVQGNGVLKEMMPFFFVALIMAGLCLGLLVRQLLQQREDNRNLPK